MSQASHILANENGLAHRTSLNATLAAIQSRNSGAAEPSDTEPYMLWADTANNVLKQRTAADDGWIIVASLAEDRVLARSSNTILGVSSFDCTIVATSTFTQTFAAAATLGDGWRCFYRNDGSGTITLDPNGSETIDGATTTTLAPGESCVIMSDGAALKTFARSATVPSKHFAGLGLTNNGTDATNDIDIAAGEAADSTGSVIMKLAASITKRLDAAWAVGSGQGMLDTGSKTSSTWYHLYLIRRPDTGVVDVIASTNGSAPSLPTNYTQYRLIGSIYVASTGVIRQFRNFGAHFVWADMLNGLDADAVGGTSSATRVLSVPTGRFIFANVRYQFANAAVALHLIQGAYEEDAAPSSGAAPLFDGINAAGSSAVGDVWKWTNTNAQVRTRHSAASSTVRLFTIGYMDPARLSE